MNRVKIHCFEGEWSRQHPELSVRPLLSVLEQAYISAGKQLVSSYKFCQSLNRLKENLRLDGRSLSRKSYRDCFYFAFHGDSNGLFTPDGQEIITFAEISEALAGKAAGSILFFGSCGGRTSRKALEELQEATGADLVVGYAAQVDWLASSMFEMLFFSELCRYQKLGAFENKIRKVIEQPTFAPLKVVLAGR